MCTGRLYSLHRAYLDLGEEISGSEDQSGGGTSEIPEGQVVARAARETYDECSEYFTFVRDSLRNIALEIEKCKEQRNLIHSDVFWQQFISKVVRTKTTEPQLWDLKETLTVWHIRQGEEREKAKVTLAEDVASLANARGGVLVVGVTDGTRDVVGIGTNPRDVENRLKVAREVIAKHVEYDRELVSFRQIVFPGEDGEKVCLVIVVAQACEVASVHDGQGHYTYPVRHETGINRVSRDQLLGKKMHMKSDNHDFVGELNQFIRDE